MTDGSLQLEVCVVESKQLQKALVLSRMGMHEIYPELEENQPKLWKIKGNQNGNANSAFSILLRFPDRTYFH